MRIVRDFPPLFAHKTGDAESPSIGSNMLPLGKGHRESRPWRTIFDRVWPREAAGRWLWNIGVRVRHPDR